MQAKKNKEFIHYFPSAGRCSAISRMELREVAENLRRILPPQIMGYDCHFFF